MEKIINIAVIAHVDAGKSTLVDAMLKQTGTLSGKDEEVSQVMDSNDLERERGIKMGAGIKMVANNKKAYHDYFIDDKLKPGSSYSVPRSNRSAWVNAASRKHL